MLVQHTTAVFQQDRHTLLSLFKPHARGALNCRKQKISIRYRFESGNSCSGVARHLSREQCSPTFAALKCITSLLPKLGACLVVIVVAIPRDRIFWYTILLVFYNCSE